MSSDILICLLVTGLGLALLGEAVQADTPSPNHISIVSGRLRELRIAGRSIVSRPHEIPIWRLDLYDRQGEQIVTLTVDGAEGWRVTGEFLQPGRNPWTYPTRWHIYRGQQRVCILKTWHGHEQNELFFSAAIESLDGRYEVDRLWYPQFPLEPLSDDGSDDRLLVPRMMGQIIENPHTAEQRPWGRGEDRYNSVARTRYPSKMGSLQMQYYFDTDGGLLMTTPDPTRRIKELIVDRPGKTLRATFVHFFPPKQVAAGQAELPYTVRLQWVDGDWYDAARVYRDWASRQEWWNTPLHDRPGRPDWWATLPSWVRIPRDPGPGWENKTAWPLKWVRAVGGPMGVHWYGWDAQGGPNNYIWPKSLPPHPQFDELVARYHQNDLYVFPYLNARIACLQSPLWEQYKDTIVRTRNGELAAVETWSSYFRKEQADAYRADGRRVKGPSEKGIYKVFFDFAPGSIIAPAWRQSLLDRMLELLLNTDVDGVYQDQYGAWAMIDYHPEHRPGDPDAWQDGYEQLYGEVRRRLAEANKPAAIFAEYITEAMIPHVDGGLAANLGMVQFNTSVPLFQAVYHTHFATIGYPDNPSYVYQDPSIYLHQRMVPLVYGSQMGWISYVMPRLVEKHPAIVSAYKAGVELRRRFGAMLGYGRMLRPPTVLDVPTAKAPIAKPQIELQAEDWPVVLSGFFREGQAGPRALAVLANWSDQPQAGRLRLDLCELDRPVRIGWVDGPSAGRFDQPTAELDFAMPPNSVRALLVEPAGEKP